VRGGALQEDGPGTTRRVIAASGAELLKKLRIE